MPGEKLSLADTVERISEEGATTVRALSLSVDSIAYRSADLGTVSPLAGTNVDPSVP
jgi:hypothetical protein